MRVILRRLISGAHISLIKRNIRLCSSDAQKKPDGEIEKLDEVRKSKVMFTYFVPYPVPKFMNLRLHIIHVQLLNLTEPQYLYVKCG